MPYADTRFNPSFDAALDYLTKDIFCMPIVNRTGQTVGVLELLNRSEPFREDDLEFLSQRFRPYRAGPGECVVA